MILLIDNYDSFSYNLVQMAGSMGQEIKVIRNDEKSVQEIRSMAPAHIILSPGPGYPKDAGICIETVKTLAGKIPILGVCLGHQAICEAYGGRIVPAKQLMHGKKSRISIDSRSAVFQGMEDHMDAARYHSLIAEEKNMPRELRVTARAENGEIMAAEHREYPVFGVQFHPESILTPMGHQIITNFLKTKIGDEM